MAFEYIPAKHIYQGSTAPVRVELCRAEVRGRERGALSHQCTRRPVTEPDETGLRWCKAHDPVTEATRQAQSQAAWNKRIAGWDDTRNAIRFRNAIRPLVGPVCDLLTDLELHGFSRANEGQLVELRHALRNALAGLAQAEGAG